MAPSGIRTCVLVDPHPLWLEALDDLVRSLDFQIVGTTSSPAAALDIVADARPDLLITALELRGGHLDGIRLLEQGLAHAPAMKVVVLGTSDDQQSVEAAFTAGASAFVVKTAHPADLAAAIRQAFDTSVYFAAPHVAARPAAPPPGESSLLTRREREILELVAEGHSNAQMARMLWVTEQTIKFHLSNVYRKLDVANRTEASRWAQVNGLLSIPAPAESAVPTPLRRAADARVTAERADPGPPAVATISGAARTA
jgi:DNA-binding NarL/FixJ family response regulator